MKKTTGHTTHDKDSFVKGMLIGITSTVLFAGIGAFIAYQFYHLKRQLDSHNRKIYDYSSEGNITPDSDLAASTDDKFLRDNERLEKDYEVRFKELEDVEEMTRKLQEKL